MSTNIGSKSAGSGGGASMAAASVPKAPISGAEVLSSRMRAPNAIEAGARSGANTFGRENIFVSANVDRRGLAISVREGERELRTVQTPYN
jgi:hypothetical protein